MQTAAGGLHFLSEQQTPQSAKKRFAAFFYGKEDE